MQVACEQKFNKHENYQLYHLLYGSCVLGLRPEAGIHTTYIHHQKIESHGMEQTY